MATFQGTNGSGFIHLAVVAGNPANANSNGGNDYEAVHLV